MLIYPNGMVLPFHHVEQRICRPATFKILGRRCTEKGRSKYVKMIGLSLETLDAVNNSFHSNNTTYEHTIYFRFKTMVILWSIC